MLNIKNKLLNDKYYFLIGFVLVILILMLHIYRENFISVVDVHLVSLNIFGTNYNLNLFDGILFTSFILITIFTAWYFGGHSAFLFVSISWNFEVALFVVLTGRYELIVEFVNILLVIILYFTESPPDKKARLQRQIIENTNQRLIKTNKIFQRFVPVEFINLIGKKCITDINAGDSAQEKITIMFCDIRSFTKLSQNMQPKEVFDFLNSFLKEVGPVIRKHNGFIDKYLGDGIMALFSRCSSDAVKCALEMSDVLREFNKKNEQFNIKVIRTGTGIHTGDSILGTIGEDERIETTVISDAVNLSSRLEDLTKTYGVEIIISEQLYLEVKDKINATARYLDEVIIKGTDYKLKIYEVITNGKSTLSQLKIKNKEKFESAVHLMNKNQYKEAHKIFSEIASDCSDDYPAKYHMAQCKQFIQDFN